MSDDTQIPLLEDLIQKGEVVDEDESASIRAFDQGGDMEIEPDQPQTEPAHRQQHQHQNTTDDDDLSDDASVRELIIDEEIRMILDKHMDEAYQEIIRLLNHRIS